MWPNIAPDTVSAHRRQYALQLRVMISRRRIAHHRGEMEDRYVILPAYSERVLDDYLEEGHKLVLQVSLSQACNTDWLDGDDLQKRG